jgi:hypothetical protein
MGIYRSTPLTDKTVDENENEQIGYAACSMQGFFISPSPQCLIRLESKYGRFTHCKFYLRQEYLYIWCV